MKLNVIIFSNLMRIVHEEKRKKEKKTETCFIQSKKSLTHTSRHRDALALRRSSYAQNVSSLLEREREKQEIRTIYPFSPLSFSTIVFFSTTRLFTTNDPTLAGKILEPDEETTRRNPPPRVQAIRSNARNERK